MRSWTSGRREATKASAKKGYLDGATLAEVFAWLRPNDLIWNYWVNNYLLGRPPAFDILYWNADTARMSAALHRDFLDIAVRNSLTDPGRARMLGTPVDLGGHRRLLRDRRHRRPPLPVAVLLPDHPAARWDSRFVLSTSGHIASLVNPPSNPKSTWRTAPPTSSDADAWLETAHREGVVVGRPRPLGRGEVRRRRSRHRQLGGGGSPPGRGPRHVCFRPMRLNPAADGDGRGAVRCGSGAARVGCPTPPLLL